MHLLIAHNAYGRPSGEEHALGRLDALLTGRGHRVSRFERTSAEIGSSLWAHGKAAVAGINNPFSRRHLMQVLAETRPDVVLVQNLYPFLSPSILSACHAYDVPVVMRCCNYRLFCPSGTLQQGGSVCTRCLGPGREAWCVLKNCEQSLPKSLGYALRHASARLGRRITTYVDQYIVLTEFQKRFFEQQGVPADRLTVVPNHAAVQGPGRTDGPLVSMLGRVSPEKGIADLLALARRLPEVPFALAGAIRPGMESLLATAPANVRIHGHLAGPALAALLDETRIVLSCSRCFEGFPNAVLEAMAAGKPVLSAALGALTEIVEDGITGLHYPPGDMAAAAAALQSLYADPARCAAMGRAAQARVAALYHEDQAYIAYMSAFERAREGVLTGDLALEADGASLPLSLG